MRVGLITSWGNVCGLASYAEQLVKHKPKDVEYIIYDHSGWTKEALMGGKFDVLHCNYAAGQFNCEQMIQEVIKEKGCGSVVTEHLSHEGNNWTDFTKSFDVMVCHERLDDGSVFIPMGIPEVDVIGIEVENRIGTAGFARHWKGMLEMAYAAKLLNMGVTIIAPRGHGDTDDMEQRVRQLNPDCQYFKEWLPMEEVVRKLAACKVTMFAYKTQGMGPYIDVGSSSAVRMGLASGRPTVVTGDCRQFNDLKLYFNEVEFASTNHYLHLCQAVERVLASDKKPKRILQDYGWTRVGELYRDVYTKIQKGEKQCA